MSEAQDPHPGRTSATVQSSRWPGWIWAVPLAALGVVAWLGVSAIINRGVEATIQFDKGDGIKANNTKVEYRGVVIGKVTAVALSKDGQRVTAKVKFDDLAQPWLNAGTRFWLKGASPSLSDLSSLTAVISGPAIEISPGRGAPARHFHGFDSRPILTSPPRTLAHYVVNFDGAVGQLKAGAPVTLRGFTVGQVEGVAMRFDPASGQLETPVTIVLDPARFHIPSAHQAPRAVLTPVLVHLVAQGLRAELTQSPPLIGGYAVTLDFLAGASNARIDESNAAPVFPANPGGGVNSIIQRANQIPLDKIAAQVLAITDQVREIVSSPALHHSVVNLDQTLTALKRTVRQSGPQISALARSLRTTAAQLDATVKAANRVLGAPPAGQDNNVRVALYELTETARSVRALADYLDRHPGALLRGNAG